jgi:hypothetical protein
LRSILSFRIFNDDDTRHPISNHAFQRIFKRRHIKFQTTLFSVAQRYLILNHAQQMSDFEALLRVLAIFQTTLFSEECDVILRPVKFK